jgi:hypothetical protein
VILFFITLTIFQKGGSMKEKNLYCLVCDNQHVNLTLVKFSQLLDKPEINLQKEVYATQAAGYCRIGQDSGRQGQIRFIFDRTNLKHLKRALEVAQDFQR